MLFLTGILIVICLRGIASSCTCPPTHRQEQFCKDPGYAILGRVVSVTDSSSDQPNALRTFLVEVLKVFRGPRYLVFGAPVSIRTPMDSALCGINLTVNKYYFLAGEMPNIFDLRIGLCDWFSEWASLKSCERAHLIVDRYKNNCRCKIRHCQAGSECDTTSLECPLYPNQPQRQSGYCGLNGGDECRWNRCIPLAWPQK